MIAVLWIDSGEKDDYKLSYPCPSPTPHVLVLVLVSRLFSSSSVWSKIDLPIRVKLEGLIVLRFQLTQLTINNRWYGGMLFLCLCSVSRSCIIPGPRREHTTDDREANEKFDRKETRTRINSAQSGRHRTKKNGPIQETSFCPLLVALSWRTTIDLLLTGSEKVR
jgi:hypothetical protein